MRKAERTNSERASTMLSAPSHEEELSSPEFLPFSSEKPETFERGNESELI